VSGGSYIGNYYADLTLVPIYVRAGAILPFCELEQWVGQLAANPLTFNCYPGPDRWSDAQAYQLYQDDGITNAAAKSASYRLSRIYQRTQVKNGVTTRQIRIARMHDQYAPLAGYYFVALLGSISSAQQVSRDGTGVNQVSGASVLQNSSVDAWYWNASIDIVFVKLFDNRADTTVSIGY
jgi:alpha-glucosidase